MALLINKQLENGINVQYHRIVSITNIVNVQSIIEVASYINSETRKDDVPSSEEKNVFIDTQYYNFDYDEDMNISKAYQTLKDLEEFKGAKDI